MKRILSLVLLAGTCLAQRPVNPPLAVGAFLSNGSGGWNPWALGSGLGTLPYPPLKVSLYCSADGVTWTTCNPGGGSSMVYPGSGIGVSTGTAWGTSLTAPIGAIVGTTDTQTLSNKTLTAPNIGAATGSSLVLSGGAIAANLGFGESAITSCTGVADSAQLVTITLAASCTLTLANGSVGRNICLQFIQPATGGPFIVTPPATLLGFFSSNAGLIGTTASKGSEQCFVWSGARTAWTPTNTGIINF